MPDETRRWEAAGLIAATDSSTNKLTAYMIANFFTKTAPIPNTPPMLRIREFVADAESDKTTILTAFFALVQYHLRVLRNEDSIQELKVRLPQPIFEIYLNVEVGRQAMMLEEGMSCPSCAPHVSY